MWRNSTLPECNIPSDPALQSAKKIKWNLTILALQKGGTAINEKAVTPALTEFFKSLSLSAQIYGGLFGAVAGLTVAALVDYYTGNKSDFANMVSAVETALDHRDAQMFQGGYKAAEEQLFVEVPAMRDARAKAEKLTRQEEELGKIQHTIEARIKGVSKWDKAQALMFDVWCTVTATRFAAAFMMEEMRVMSGGLVQKQLERTKASMVSGRFVAKYTEYRRSQIEYSPERSAQRTEPGAIVNPHRGGDAQPRVMKDHYTGKCMSEMNPGNVDWVASYMDLVEREAQSFLHFTSR